MPHWWFRFDNPSAILWAVMALARLHEKLPTHNDALGLSQQGIPSALRLRNALDEMITAFCDDRMEATWSTLSVEQAFPLISELRDTGSDYYYYLLSDEYADHEFNYLFDVLWAFDHTIAKEEARDYGDAYGALGTVCAVAIRLADVIGSIIKGMFRPLNALAATEGSSREAINDYAEEILDHMCVAVEQFIRDQADLKTTQNHDTDGSIGESFARITRVPLRQHIDVSFRLLLEDLGFRSGHTVDEDSTETKARVALFLRQVARFFSYASPLLSEFFVPNDEDLDGDDDGNEPPPEHIANHDFANYDDTDWHWNEVYPFDGQDELRGPETVAPDDVSVIATVPKDKSCALCGGEEIEMRRIKICSHELCAACLTKQLNAQHECRYKCAFCRGSLFPAMT
jgi:hypothetical protein